MRNLRSIATVLGCSLTVCAAVTVDEPSLAVAAPGQADLQATLLRSYSAEEADQGVAVDAQYFYAIDNHTIGKYRRDNGDKLIVWEGDDHGPLQHINSCQVAGERLICAHSNYPSVPMASSVEWFETQTLQPAGSHSLGIDLPGSLTWVVPWSDGYLACFAHYDHRPPESRDHRHTTLIHYDAHWRRQGGWTFPETVLQRLAPYSASGGALGDDGLLYVMGHDRPELYVLGLPWQSSVLVHIATIAISAEGQAFVWDFVSERTIYAIDRRRHQVLVFKLPAVDIPAHARRFPASPRQ